MKQDLELLSDESKEMATLAKNAKFQTQFGRTMQTLGRAHRFNVHQLVTVGAISKSDEIQISKLSTDYHRVLDIYTKSKIRNRFVVKVASGIGQVAKFIPEDRPTFTQTIASKLAFALAYDEKWALDWEENGPGILEGFERMSQNLNIRLVDLLKQMIYASRPELAALFHSSAEAMEQESTKTN